MPSPFHKHPRLPDRDYTKGKYFITINTASRGDILGSIVGKDAEARMELNEAGLIVSECFQAIPIHHPNSRIAELQLMPDHLHAIVVLGSTVSMGPGSQGKALGEKISGSTQWVDGTGIQQEIRDGEEQSPRDGDADEMPNAPKGPRRGSLSAIMAVFKSESTKRINALRRQPGRPFWKKGYYEHVIREYAGEYERIAQYIAENPMKWK
jgi:REP element-mobilizing transposase RayT